MSADVLVLELPAGYEPGQEIHHPDDPPGEWDWLINLLVGPLRDRLWSSFVGYVQGQFSSLLDPLRQIRDRLAWLLAALWSVPGAIRDEVRGLKDRLVATLAYWLWRLLSSADALRHQAVAVLSSLPHVVVGGLRDLVAWLVGALSSLPHVVGGYLASQFGPLIGVVANIPNILRGALYEFKVSWEHHIASLRQAVAGGLPGLAIWIASSLDAIPGRLGQTLLGMYQGLFVWLQHAWNSVIEGARGVTIGVLTLGGRVLSEAARILAEGPPPELRAITDNLTARLQAGLVGIQDMIIGQGQITPELAPEIGVRAFLTASAIGFGAHVLSTAIELAHPLRYVGLHYLSGFLGQMGAFSTISYAVMGVMVREAVANPMAYHVRARTRPTIPTSGDLQAMRRKHNLTPSEFAQYMAYQGYTDFWIKRFEEYLPADPRLYEILRMADTHLPTGTPPPDAIPLLERLGIRSSGNPDWWLEMKFALAGYNWIDIPQLIETVRNRLTNSARLRHIATSALMFRNGYMTEEQFRLELAEAGQNEAQVDWRVRAEKLAALKDDVDDLVKLYTDRYLKDVINEDELLVALVNAGVTPHKAQILVHRAAIRKMPRPARPARAEEERELRKLQAKYSELYRRQYQADLITADQYFENLLAIGISDRLAAVTVQVEMARRAVQARKVAIRAEHRATTKTRRVYERLYREQFRAGELDPDGYYERLVDVGLTADQARGTVALELLKMYQLQERAELKAEEKLLLQEQREKARLYIRRYRAGDITAELLLERLRGLGIPDVLAETAVELERLKRREDTEKILAQVIVPALKVPFELAVRRLRELLRAGEISGEEFVAELLESGLAEETAALIGQVLT